LSEEEKKDIIENEGKIEIKCSFCKKAEYWD